jgi:hypothetical protein
MANGERAHGLTAGTLTADTFDSTHLDDKFILHTPPPQAQSAGRKEKPGHSDGGQEVKVDGRQELDGWQAGAGLL